MKIKNFNTFNKINEERPALGGGGFRRPYTMGMTSGGVRGSGSPIHNLKRRISSLSDNSSSEEYKRAISDVLNLINPEEF
jgi:hypothetical protein